MLIIACQGGSDDLSWNEFVYKDANFAIEFPQEPELDTLVSQTQLGQSIMPNYKVEIDSNVYSVGYSRISDSLAITSSLQMIFEGALSGLIKSQNGRLLRRQYIGLDRFPGQDALLELGNGRFTFRLRMFVVNRRMYQIFAAVPGNDTTRGQMGRFVESFRLLEIPELQEPQMENWARYVSPDKSFEASFPGQPTVNSRKMENLPGQPDMDLIVMTTKFREFSIVHTKYAEQWRNMNSPAQIFKNYRNGVLAEFDNFTDMQETETEFEGLPAYEIEFELRGNQGHFRGIAILKDSQLYQLLVLSPSQDPHPQYALQFFDSFKFIQ